MDKPSDFTNWTLINATGGEGEVRDALFVGLVESFDFRDIVRGI